MKVLAIGNSFSQDATRYLHQIAKSDGTDIMVANLCIGGCPLRTHYVNILDDIKGYGLEINGVPTGFKVSIKDALISNEWDVITIQQASFKSPHYETYQPYLNTIEEYLRKFVPQAKIYVHQTWAYADTYPRLATLGFTSMKDMFSHIEKAYDQAAKDINADGIILSGKALLTAVEKGVESVHRDGFHAKLGFGRYLIALTWYKTLTGKSVLTNNFADFDEPIEAHEIELAKQIAESMA